MRKRVRTTKQRAMKRKGETQRGEIVGLFLFFSSYGEGPENKKDANIINSVCGVPCAQSDEPKVTIACISVPKILKLKVNLLKLI